METAETLAEAYPKQQARCRELLKIYESLGPSGTFGAMFLRDILARADKAVADQDTVAMIQAYKAMEEFKE